MEIGAQQLGHEVAVLRISLCLNISASRSGIHVFEWRDKDVAERDDLINQYMAALVRPSRSHFHAEDVSTASTLDRCASREQVWRMAS